MCKPFSRFGQGIEVSSTIATRFDQSGVPEQTEVMTDCGLALSEVGCDRLSAHLTVRK
jgi:hypothetical protein